MTLCYWLFPPFFLFNPTPISLHGRIVPRLSSTYSIPCRAPDSILDLLRLYTRDGTVHLPTLEHRDGGAWLLDDQSSWLSHMGIINNNHTSASLRGGRKGKRDKREGLSVSLLYVCSFCMFNWYP